MEFTKLAISLLQPLNYTSICLHLLRLNLSDTLTFKPQQHVILQLLLPFQLPLKKTNKSSKLSVCGMPKLSESPGGASRCHTVLTRHILLLKNLFHTLACRQNWEWVVWAHFWASWGCPCSLQRGWTRWPLGVPANLGASMILATNI